MALDLLDRLQGQLRSTGHGVTGLDMTAALTLMKMRGIDNPVVLDLIETGEAAMVNTINEHIKDGQNE